MRLETGQVSVVTGAASGIGLALAEALAARGLIVAMADVELAPLEREARRLIAAGARVAAFQCDVGDAQAVASFRDFALRRFGRIDLVCNNAGVALPLRPLWEAVAEEWEWILDVNLRGVMNGILAFVPHLIAQGQGHVVNTASMAGVTTIAGNGPYNATKHAVVSLTETLQADLSAAGSAVRATVICCGLVRTRIREAARNRPVNAAPGSDGRGFVPSAGAHLEPAEVARQTLDAVERDRLYLFTHPGAEARIRARMERLLAELR